MKNEKKDFDDLTFTIDTPEEVIEQHGLECDKCNQCCKVDAGIVLQEDLQRIADYLQIPVEELKNEFLVEHEKFNTKVWKLKQLKEKDKPYGPCVFLKEDKGCVIHEVKPKHCKLCSTKSKHGEKLSIWFALNYLVNADDPESIRQSASYLKTHPTIPGGELQELVEDPEKLKKILSYEYLKENKEMNE